MREAGRQSSRVHNRLGGRLPRGRIRSRARLRRPASALGAAEVSPEHVYLVERPLLTVLTLVVRKVHMPSGSR